jgi:molybdopterin converting factor small subunit
MAAISVRIPTLLAQVGDGRTVIAVEADSVSGALEALFSALPQLRVHIFDETGGVRPHVALFHQGRSVRDAADLATPLVAGDVVTVLQAVSGG